MALAPRTVQNIPHCLTREPITVLQPASTTPEPTNRSPPCRGHSLGPKTKQHLARERGPACFEKALHILASIVRVRNLPGAPFGTPAPFASA